LISGCSGNAGQGAPDGHSPGDGGPDAGTIQDGPSSAVWTQRSQSSLLEIYATMSGIWADPSQSSHFLLGLSSNPSKFLVEATNGSFGSPLAITQVNVTSLQFCGAGFAGGDGLFAYYGGFPTANQQTPYKVATASVGGTWSWIDLAPMFSYPSWPPRSLAVGTGAKPRELLYSDSAIWDITGKLDPTGVLMWPMWSASALTPSSEGGFAALRFLPGDSNTFLAAMVSKPTLHRCTFASSLTCATAEATGFAAGDTIGSIEIAKSDSDRVYVTARSAAFVAELYVSTDGGRTFAPVPLPSSDVSFDKSAFSPTSPDTIATYFEAYEKQDGTNVPDRLIITHDRGATWTQIALPMGPATTDVDGFAFDAAGTLFLARGSILFSATL
jgi:hypothetical protein